MTDIPPHQLPKDTGWIEVITGCMFSGKTEELIRRLRRAQIAKQKVKKRISTQFRQLIPVIQD